MHVYVQCVCVCEMRDWTMRGRKLWWVREVERYLDFFLKPYFYIVNLSHCCLVDIGRIWLANILFLPALLEIIVFYLVCSMSWPRGVSRSDWEIRFPIVYALKEINVKGNKISIQKLTKYRAIMSKFASALSGMVKRNKTSFARHKINKF